MSDKSWYVMCAIESHAHGEYDDCAVRSVSIATGLPYATVHRSFKHRGRQPCSGVTMHVIRGALSDLGYYLIPLDPPGKTFRTAVRSLQNQPPRGPVLLTCKTHIACFRDGELQDHAGERLYRVESAYRLGKTLYPRPL